jgi:hypothetical protein
MRFDRDDPADHSPAERAVLRALGVERLDYRPAGPREDVVPERVLRQERMREEEEARLREEEEARLREEEARLAEASS